MATMQLFPHVGKKEMREGVFPVAAVSLCPPAAVSHGSARKNFFLDESECINFDCLGISSCKQN